LRAGRISPSELTPAPWGLLGWHLFPYFVGQKWAEGRPISDFGWYVTGNGPSLEIAAPAPITGVAGAALELPRDSADGTIARGVFRLGWHHAELFRLYRRTTPQPALIAIDPEAYRLEPFPLNDAEWRQLLHAPPR
jgi:hypothetical protein